VKEPGVWWLAAAGILVIAELFTGTFILLMLGAGAFAASMVALGGGPPWAQALVFIVVSAVALWLVRPWMNQRMRRNEPQELGLAQLEGAEAVVVERVEAGSGMIKIDGELWRARPSDAAATYVPGDRVRVIRVDGATAWVGRDQ